MKRNLTYNISLVLILLVLSSCSSSSKRETSLIKPIEGSVQKQEKIVNENIIAGSKQYTEKDVKKGCRILTRFIHNLS